MSRGLVRANIRWLIRALSLRPNPLRRLSDRVTAALTIFLIASAVMVVPVAATAGNVIYEQGLSTAAAAASARHQVEAVVTGHPEIRLVGSDPRIQTTEVWARVRWSGADGRQHEGAVAVRSDSRVGSTVPLWVDRSDQIAVAPLTETHVLASAVMGALMIMLASQAMCIAAIIGLRLFSDARARRAWQREWEIVGPKWTRQEH
jgi:hypothetical protein